MLKKASLSYKKIIILSLITMLQYSIALVIMYNISNKSLLEIWNTSPIGWTIVAFSMLIFNIGIMLSVHEKSK